VFLVLSKLFDLAVTPIAWALLLILLAGLLRHRGRTPLVLGALAFLVLFGFATPAMATRLTRLAERGVATTYRPDAVYDAAIVLGGSVDGAASTASGQTELGEAVERITTALELFRAGKVRTIVLSGGNINPLPNDPPESERIAVLLERWGVPRDRIVVEGRSRNTRENAIEAARIASERQLLSTVLVTSAWHMPRALGCFRAVGLTPDALPVDHRASGVIGLSWLPRAEALVASTVVLRELTGRAVYRVLGYTR